MHDRVLIKKIELVKKTASGLVLPGDVNPTFEATVIAVGNGRPVEGADPIPVAVNVGDRVLYNQNATISVTINRESLMVIKEEDIFAVIEEN